MRSKTDHTKMYPEDLNPPHRELSNGGLVIVVAFLVRPGNDSSCVSTGGPIQLYLLGKESRMRTSDLSKTIKAQRGFLADLQVCSQKHKPAIHPGVHNTAPSLITH